MARFAVGLSLVHLQSFNSIFKTDCRKECGLAVRRLSFLFALPLCLVGIGSAQADPSAGIQMFSTRENNVDLATSSITVNFPIRSKTGKIPVSFSLVGNYHVYGKLFLASISSTSLLPCSLNCKPTITDTPSSTRTSRRPSAMEFRTTTYFTTT